MKKEDCNMTILRLFMGVQMLMFGLFSCLAEPWNTPSAFLQKGGWLWPVMILIGGLWLLSLALLDIRLGNKWEGLGTAKYRKYAVWLGKARLLGFHFSGCVWAGYGYTTMANASIRTADFMPPIFVVFLLFLAFKDAARKRTKAVLKNEARQTTISLSAGSAGDSLRT